MLNFMFSFLTHATHLLYKFGEKWLQCFELCRQQTHKQTNEQTEGKTISLAEVINTHNRFWSIHRMIAYLWLLRGSGVRETLRIGLPLCEGDCRRWPNEDVPQVSKRRWGLVEPLILRLRFAGDGERRPAAATGDRVSLPGRPEDNMGLLLWRGGDEEVGGVRLRLGGELLRLGDLEGRRFNPGEERFAGEPDIFLFCGGKGEGL